MNKLILLPTTRQQLDHFTSAPSHALLLLGPSGSGKQALAQATAEALLDVPQLETYPYSTIVRAKPDATAIGIEAIRELEQFLALKVPRRHSPNRIVVIEDAHQLTIEAQNALLKTLEEPPQGTVLILTAHHEQALLPTIRSRTQALHVGKPERAALENHFNTFEAAAIKQAYAVSGGLPGLMHALLNEADHPLTQATAQARQLLSQSTYERLLMVDTLAKQKPLATDLAFILQQMAHVSLQTAAGPAANSWQKVLMAAHTASEALAVSAQPKLVLTQLMLSM
jgi:replication-associated recombination protein RarA